ncbi:MAG: 30S ribosomal protein S6 [candidate division WOR-3 bacterium]
MSVNFDTEIRCYESMVIFNPDLSDEEFEKALEWVKGIIEKNGATLIKIDVWGKRKLAYEINKKKDGIYVLFYFRSTPDFVDELERNYRINSNVMRFLTVRLKEKKCQSLLTE